MTSISIDPQPSPPGRIMLLHTSRLSASAALAAEIAERLKGWHVDTSIEPVETDGLGQRLDGVDMVIALGGDGTMLRAGCLTAPHAIPVLGVNLGRLGFLAEVQAGEWPEVLARVMASDYWLEQRMMLRVSLERDGALLRVVDVLNEVAVGRGLTGRTVRIDAYIDDALFMKYIADGVIVSTATGSTAYALAAGGPILPPELKNILLIAVAPHLILDRPIVLGEGTHVDLRVASKQPTVLSADGRQPIELALDDRIRVQASPYVCRLVRVRPRSYFYRTLTARMARNPAAELEINPHQ